LTTIVSGPGQYNCASCLNKAIIFASNFGSINSKAYSSEWMWTISGSVKGLPLAAKIDLQASTFKAFAPKPYTVSVENATSFPSYSNLEAF
jgi:hypothetical protein